GSPWLPPRCPILSRSPAACGGAGRQFTMKPCYGKGDHFATFARSMFADSSTPVLKNTCNLNTKVLCTRIVIEVDVSSFSTFVCSPTHPAAFCLSAYLNDEMNRVSRPVRPILLGL